jgi:hypothetical protein
MVAEGAPDAAFWSRYKDGWGLVRGTVRLGSGEPVGHCGVLYYAMTLPADRIPDIGILTSADGTYSYHCRPERTRWPPTEMSPEWVRPEELWTFR